MAYTDAQIKNYAHKLKAAGASMEEISNFIRKAKREQSAAIPPSGRPADIPLNIAKGIGEAGVRGTAGFLEGAGNLVQTVGQLADTVNPVNIFSRLTGIGKPVDIAQTATKSVQQAGRSLSDIVKSGSRRLNVEGLKGAELNLESIPGELGDLAGRIAAAVPATVAAGAADAAATARIPAGFTKMHPLLAKLIPAVAESPITTTGIVGSLEGRPPNAQELGIGLGLDVGLRGMSYLLRKLSGHVYRQAINPETASPRKVQAAAEQASDLNLTGSRDKILAKIDKLMPKVGAELDDAIGSHTKLYSREAIANKLTAEAVKVEKTGLPGSLQASKMLKEYANVFKSTGKPMLTATELLDLKRAARDTILGALKRSAKSGKALLDAATVVKQEATAMIYNQIDDILDNISPTVRNANQKFNTLFAVEAATMRGLRHPLYLNLINPLGMLKNFPSLVTRTANTISKGSAFGITPLRPIVKAAAFKAFAKGFLENYPGANSDEVAEAYSRIP